MLLLQDLSYLHPNKELLFENIHLSINRNDKIALIGNNGSGKSTLLKIIAGILPPSKGLVKTGLNPYYIPQVFGQFNDLTISQALHVADKLKALQEILSGNVTETYLSTLNDDWTIETRCLEAFAYWGLEGFDLNQKMDSLSGGEKTKVFLAGILVHQPELVLMDEPSNHLDGSGRERLYQFISTTLSTLIVVSHDRHLLNLLDYVYELSKRGITAYGGNYDFYVEQKEIESNALNQDLKSREKALRKAKEVEKETRERKEKLDARGKRKQEKAGVPTIAMNTLRNNAEKSSSRLKGVHAEKIEGISRELNDLRNELPDMDKMKFGFDNATLHKSKLLFAAREINYGYTEEMIWQDPLTIEIRSGERINVKGPNGSGKTTLIKIILGEIEPKGGSVLRTDFNKVYIDQDYSLIDDKLTVYQQAAQFNITALQEHEIKVRLTRFLFSKEYWDQCCNTLSGGEKMRLMLCCLTIQNKAPDMIILDEPTNNLDIQNIEILTAAINDYQGTLIVISHDEYFLKEIGVERMIGIK